MTKYDFNTVIDRKNTYCTQWDFIKDRFGVDDLLPFTISDMDLASPDFIINALHKRLEHPVFGYSRWQHDDYRNAIIGWYQRRFNFNILSDNILYSPSVIYSVSLLLSILKEKHNNNQVIIQTPAYDGFFNAILHNKCQIIENKLDFDNNDGLYKINFELLEQQCQNAKILLLCSPHNPTGRVWTQTELTQIINICQKHNVSIISDEIHMDTVLENTHIPMLKIAQELNYNQHVYIATSASKTFNIPAFGGSFCIIENNDMIDKFNYCLKGRDGLSSPMVMGMIATIQAYNHGDQWVDKLKIQIKNNYQIINDFLTQHCPDLKLEHSQSTYLAWINAQQLKLSDEQIQDALINKGKVAIMSGSTYKSESGYLRMNVGCSQDKVRSGLNAIKKSFYE